jgi:hypothetical protein
VLCKAAQKLAGRKRHDALPVAVGVVSPEERDLFAIEGQQPMIETGDCQLEAPTEYTRPSPSALYFPPLPRLQDFVKVVIVPELLGSLATRQLGLYHGQRRLSFSFQIACRTGNGPWK